MCFELRPITVSPDDPIWPTIADIPRVLFSNYYSGREFKHHPPKKSVIYKKLWFQHFGNECLCCHRRTMQVNNPNKKNFATIDHVLARSLGGHPHALHNLTVICSDCNSTKSGFESKLKQLLLDSAAHEEELLLAA